ncbi:tyrosine-type recombinase/integrase [Deinococcus sp. ZS9-10]|uniref:Tyrosine-type recombinase/integrase n=2 Tax=Deinococcus arenicola TaxID=2994950 RepID=A0ABU4DML4_9DEIO|nr:tyrosine-type recombinase/integrase [Deinococcus sp. ZS9-10]
MGCRQRGHSKATLAAYRTSLDKFTVYAEAAGVTRAEAVTRTLLRSYASSLTEQMSPGGAHARLRPLKTFFLWLEADEVVEKSPMQRVSMPKLPRQILPAVEPQDVERLMAAALCNRHPQRDRAVIAVLYDTGLRVSELCGLQLDDIQPGGRLNIRQAKGGKDRIVPISRVGLRHLARYVQTERPTSPLAEVFLTLPDTAVCRDTVKQLLARLCQAAGTAIYSPHAFRRGFAVNYLRNSGDVFTLQRILGHASLEMTNRYAVLNTEDLKDVHRRASPMSALK